MGRPSNFSQAMADRICSRIAEGESLRSVCRDDKMPAMSTVFRWLQAHKSFQEQYARAKEVGLESMADEILEIADDECTMVKHPADEDQMVEVVFDSTAVARNRLRVDTRKWLLSKLAPKKYGDKVDVNANHSGGITVNIKQF
jgi:hypothetical protein